MTQTSEPKGADELGLTIEGVNHFTVPVRDHEKSRQFYVELLGAEVRREPNWDSVRAGRSNSAAMAVRMCEGLELDLFYQPYGAGQADQPYPHTAYYVQAPEELDAFKSRLEHSGVPVALVTHHEQPKHGDRVEVEMHFRDPDGNPLEISCRSYPFNDRIHVGSFDVWDLDYAWRDWPKR